MGELWQGRIKGATFRQVFMAAVADPDEVLDVAELAPGAAVDQYAAALHVDQPGTLQGTDGPADSPTVNA
jgi:hypothetical protein